MANVVITLKVMPDDIGADLPAIAAKAEKCIMDFGGFSARHSIEPVAFGLKAIVFMFAADEQKGGTDPLEKAISGIEGVGSVEVTDVRRAIG
jgi:elongation factor 1-beta